MSAESKSDRNGLHRDFGRTTSPAYRAASGRVPVLDALVQLDRRAEALKDRARAHAKAFEDRWTAKEAIHIWQRLSPGGKNVSRDDVPSPEAVMKLAHRTVTARMHKRLSRIEAIKTRVHNAVIRNLAPPDVSLQFAKVALPNPAQVRSVRRKP